MNNNATYIKKMCQTIYGTCAIKKMALAIGALVVLSLTMVIKPVVVVRGDSLVPPFGFTKPINAKVFDTTTGTFFVGTQAGTTDPTFSVAQATRPNLQTTSSFSGIARDNLVNADIEFLTLSLQPNASAILGVVTDTNGAFTASTIYALPTDGSKNVTASDALNGSTDETGAIVNIAANSNYFFAAVKPSGTTFFGEEGSGVALVAITQDLQGQPILTVQNAQTGMLPGNLAQILTSSSVELTGDTDPVTFATEPTDANLVAMYYDTILDRLYVGVRIQTGMSGGDIGKAVTVASVENNILIFDPIVTNSAINPAANNIVVTQGVAQDLTVASIRTMHTSTGPTYLIINGGKGASNEVGNEIWAMPLVDDPDDTEIHGTLAAKKSPTMLLPDGRYAFTTPATEPDDLLDAMVPADELIAQVGNSPLPINSNDTIGDMQVVGDAVYVSVASSTTGQTGIFYSQALFDAGGKIARWTNWTKRAVAFDPFEQTTLPNGNVHNGSISFFAVDATTGSVWVVNGNTDQVVGITSWTTGVNIPTSLPAQLNQKLLCPTLTNQSFNRKSCCSAPIRGCGSTAFLDLDQSTPGFTGPNAAPSRYALFAGNNQIIFARTSEVSDEDTDDEDSDD